MALILVPALGSSAVAGSSLRTSVPGELSIVAVNARQQQADIDDVRLNELAVAVRARAVDVNDGRPVAPDILVVNELYYTQVPKFEADLNGAYGSDFDCSASTSPCPYVSIGTDGGNRARIFVNTKTIASDSVTSWVDVCDSTRSYQTARLTQASTGKPFTVAGVHFSSTYSTPGDCRQMNVDALRRQLAGTAGPIFVAGDFNKRAMTTERECDPEESSATLTWWNDMTSASTVDDRSYSDSVRVYRRASNLQLGNQWSHEQGNPSQLCDGTSNYKRGRIDYVFSSDGVKALEAHVDAPGWAVEQVPGSNNCPSTDPSCRYSDHRFVWCRFQIAPMPPVDPVGVTASADSSTQVTVRWGDVADETSYSIERSGDGVSWQEIGSTGQNATSFSDQAATPNTTYHYRIVAINAVGPSRPSGEAAVTTPDGNVPGTPASVTATAPSSTRIDISWSDVAGETQYTVERYNPGTAQWVDVATRGQDVTTFADSSVTPATTYRYRIIASNAYGSSPPSTVATATTAADTTAPSAPTNLRGTAHKGSITLDWTASTDSGGSGIAGYEVWRKVSTGKSYSLLTKVPSTTYVDRSTQKGKTYSYQVKAYDGAGNVGVASSPMSIKAL